MNPIQNYIRKKESKKQNSHTMEMKAIQKEYPLASENSNLIIYKALKASSKK